VNPKYIQIHHKIDKISVYVWKTSIKNNNFDDSGISLLRARFGTTADPRTKMLIKRLFSKL